MAQLKEQWKLYHQEVQLDPSAAAEHSSLVEREVHHQIEIQLGQLKVHRHSAAEHSSLHQVDLASFSLKTG